MKNLLGGWQVSGATFFRTGTPFSVVPRTNDIAGVGDGDFGQPYNLVGDPGDMNYELYTGSGTEVGSTRPPSRRRPPARSATRRATPGTTPASSSGTSRSSRTSRLAARGACSSAPRSSTSSTTRTSGSIHNGNLQGQNQADPLSGNFGRITSKSDNPRDIQLSVRFQF